MKKFKRIIALACAAATLSSVGIISSSALTRRLYGDVNGDGVVSNADYELTSKAAVNLVTLDTYQTIAADVNGDGYVTTLDALLIRRLVIGLADEFPVGTYFVY